MRILAVSDIHNNVACVRKLRAQETNRFDVVAVPGDIGTHKAAEIFDTLKSFKCPIVYIHGNWDRPQDVKFGRTVHLVHLRVVKIGRFGFAGYSYDGPPPPGVSPGAGCAAYARDCRKAVSQAIRASGIPLSSTILLAHDRATHLDTDFPGLLLHLYGHVHTFDVRERAGTTFVNTSALDRVLPVVPKRGRGRARYANAGNYAVIEIERSGKMSVECRLLDRNWGKRRVIGPQSAGRALTADALIPEDRPFAGDALTASLERPSAKT